MANEAARRDHTISTYCYQCVAGPDLLKVRVDDGVASLILPGHEAPKRGKAEVAP